MAGYLKRLAHITIFRSYATPLCAIEMQRNVLKHLDCAATMGINKGIFTKLMTMLMLSAMGLVGTGFAEDDFRIFVVSPLEGPISNQQIFLPFTGLARGGRQQVFPGGGETLPMRSTSPLPLPGGGLGVGGAVPLRSTSPLPLPGGGLGVGGAVPFRSTSPLNLPIGGLRFGGALGLPL
ncbi:hypothetical protein DAPPUDRAFT_321124 [Daphnia pulex]|uniref:Uncharacterized protein n=1 Tax=Daphnia pulex TaxID=6669 RepID=E9GRZ9_DAPPU|nr:hypothetical protein DAPPUDRAFT_321124 [Daphnia pulex]|eukprot:EFX77748.1 hypothetical protein DAPPUDRAFT_321124 [Daphnia pulex]